ncbi:hypothetical protein ACFJIW_08135 [Tahibacter sp. UC22_41]|uniref:hypothetical protein n=1 Tax=Tahibacter sp. UC22_41 TaxID=3350178 RepID=UPI0036D8BA08
MPTVATLLLFCAAVLGLLRSTIALVFRALPGLAGGRVTVLLRRRGATSTRWLDRVQAGMSVGLALRLLVLERPQHP